MDLQWGGVGSLGDREEQNWKSQGEGFSISLISSL